MKCVNMTILVGHIATNPKVISDEPLGVKFRLATNERHFSKTKGNIISTSEFHTIKCWKQNAKFTMESLSTGNIVLVIGKLHHHKYETNDGGTGVNSEIIAHTVVQLDRIPPDVRELLERHKINI